MPDVLFDLAKCLPPTLESAGNSLVVSRNFSIPFQECSTQHGPVSLSMGERNHRRTSGPLENASIRFLAGVNPVGPFRNPPTQL